MCTLCVNQVLTTEHTTPLNLFVISLAQVFK